MLKLTTIFTLLMALSLTTIAQEKEVLDVTADSLEVRQKNGYAKFEGNVQVTRGKLKLGATELEVFYNQNDENAIDGGIEKIIARKKVTMLMNGETATGDLATYTPTNKRIILEGNVSLIRNGATIHGEQLFYNLSDGNVRLVGKKKNRVRMRLDVNQLSK